MLWFQAASLNAWCQHGQVLMRALFLASRWPPSLCVLPWQRERDRARERERAHACKQETSGISSYKGTNPTMGVIIWRFYLNLINPQRPHLQIPSLWWLELQHTNFGAGKHAIRSTCKGSVGERGMGNEARRVYLCCWIPGSPEEASPVRLVQQLENQIMKTNTSQS